MKRIHLLILRQLRIDWLQPTCAEGNLTAEIARLINKMKALLRCPCVKAEA